MTLYVAYVTSGRDKYEYKTEFLGLFRSVKNAEKAMIGYLFETCRVLNYIYNDITNHEYALFKLFDNFQERYNKCLNEVDFIKEFKEDVKNLDLNTVVQDYSDSFYGDGWNYTIKPYVIED